MSADKPAPAPTEAARVVPRSSAAAGADTEKPPARTPARKKPSGPKKAAPKNPAAKPNPQPFTVQNVDPDSFELFVPEDDHDAWDDLGDFWGAFNPFMAFAALPPEFQEWKEDVIEQYVDSTPSEREGPC
ncbi:hypothetical protein JGS39_18165 [Streptomyces sp. P01-B04]|uniref:hypothetical protein n=1 Tax=Streptomyces poriferorum TaxID=2798799 RepID=UPI001C5F9F8F|nr:hypothetical protein [Streptomyces poriferorum]MBW5250893.1 hypothetical protein [Streptomyces poriferorum]MBW5256566.1 hypothetical protein [Streptomyces poriferorum]